MIGLGLMFMLVWTIALFVGIGRFNVFYGNVIIFLAYAFTPWTAINLVDYFFVRRGVYVVREMFNPDGIYGRWGWRGNLAYAISLGLMVPFLVTALFTGFVAKALGGVDCSIFIGLAVAATLYILFSRSLDLRHERSLADIEETQFGGEQK